MRKRLIENRKSKIDYLSEENFINDVYNNGMNNNDKRGYTIETIS